MKFMRLVTKPHIFYRVVVYLTDQQIIGTMQLLSSGLKRLIDQVDFWRYLQVSRGLTCSRLDRLKWVETLGFRKSRGEVVKVQDRLTRELYLVRKIDLQVTNSGFNNGLTTSIVRELALLHSPNSPQIHQ